MTHSTGLTEIGADLHSERPAGLVRRVFRPNEFTGWHMLGVVGLFFGTIITVNLTLAFNAATTWTGLMVPNTYVESQHFNEKLEAAEAQSRLGWKADVAASTEGIRVRLLDASGHDLKEATLSGTLGRPVQENEDRMIAFATTESGRVWSGKLAPGLWQVQLVADQGTVRRVKTVRFTVKPTEAAD
ncbi:MAG: FixH family protein [Pseudomonadota bacterium]